MGQYTFDNLKGFEDFAKKAKPGDVVITNKNFGAGSSRQQAVDCFISLGFSQPNVPIRTGSDTPGVGVGSRNIVNCYFPCQRRELTDVVFI